MPRIKGRSGAGEAAAAENRDRILKEWKSRYGSTVTK